MVMADIVQDLASSAYDDARMDGLCHDGAWEVARQKIAHLNLSQAELQQLEDWLIARSF